MKNEKFKWITEAMALYERALVGYVHGFTGSEDQARDIVQDAFIKLCQKSKDDFDGGLKAWLYKVCRNGALQLLRKENRMTELTDETMSLQSEKSPSPDVSTEKKDQYRHMMSLIGSLPTKQQEVIRLKYNHQLSYKEISDIAGLTVTNVGRLLHTGLQNLRVKMNKLQEVAR